MFCNLFYGFGWCWLGHNFSNTEFEFCSLYGTFSIWLVISVVKFVFNTADVSTLDWDIYCLPSYYSEVCTAVRVLKIDIFVIAFCADVRCKCAVIRTITKPLRLPLSATRKLKPGIMLLLISELPLQIKNFPEALSALIFTLHHCRGLSGVRWDHKHLDQQWWNTNIGLTRIHTLLESKYKCKCEQTKAPTVSPSVCGRWDITRCACSVCPNMSEADGEGSVSGQISFC